MFTQKLIQTERGQFEIFVQGAGDRWRSPIFTVSLMKTGILCPNI